MLQSTDSKRNRSESNSVTLAERFSLQQFYRKVKLAMIQVVHGCHVGQLANVMHKLCHLQPTVCGHHFNSPRGGQIVPMSDQVIQEQLNSSARTGEGRIKMNVVAAKQIQHQKQQFVDLDGSLMQVEESGTLTGVSGN